MDILFEIVFDLLFEGSLEIASDKKISKWIRYPLIVLLIFLFAVVIVSLFVLGIYIFEDSIVMSIILIVCSLLMLIGSIINFKNIYIERK